MALHSKSPSNSKRSVGSPGDFRNMVDRELPHYLALSLSRNKELIRATKGFMPPDEGTGLALSLHHCELPNLLPAVEIGSYAGLSAIYLGTVAKEQGRLLISVDHHHGSEENQLGWEYHDASLVDPVSGKMDTLYLFRRTIELAELGDSVVTVVADSERFASVYPGEIAFLFIDGGHGMDQAQNDFESWVPKIAPRGLLAIHDVFPDPALGGRAPFLLHQKALANGFSETMAQGSLRVMRRDPE